MQARGHDLTELKDLELFRGFVLARTAHAASLGGCLLGIVAIAIPFVVVIAWFDREEWPVLVPAVFGAEWLVLWAGGRAYRWWYGPPPPEPHRAELLRRHRGEPSAPAASGHGSNRLLLLSTTSLPHGGHRDVWVVVQGQGTGWIAHAVKPFEYDEDRRDRRDDSTGLVLGEASLSSEHAERIASALAAVRGKSDSNQRFAVKDGVPFDLEIHRGDAGEPLNLTGNLAARDCESHAGCRLALAILAAADAAGSPRLLYGACDFSGNVTLGQS